MPRSGIREVMDLALRRPDCIRLEIGDPDFQTPAHIVAAAADAAARGLTKYSATAGIPQLREALASKIAERNGFTVAPDQVLVTTGAVEGIYNTLVGLVDPGDGVLLPDPGWPNYDMMTVLLRAQPQRYRLDASTGYLPDIDELESLVNARTRVLILNSPSNPVGVVIGRRRMEQLLDFAARHRLWVVSDECYDEITFDGSFVSAGALTDTENVISVYSFSKTYAMTGWRIGYLAAPPAVTRVATNAHEATMSCVAMPTQYAGLAAITGSRAPIQQMVASYRDRRDAGMRILSAASVPALTPQGAFYLWVDVSGSRFGTGRDFAFALVEEAGVSVAPGSAFGPSGEGFVRVSLATELTQLEEGLRRLTAFLAGGASTEDAATTGEPGAARR
jgi:aspartate/methionine/tyrosine aminotransferase